MKLERILILKVLMLVSVMPFHGSGTGTGFQVYKHPETYLSPHGKYELFVDPSDRMGYGGAQYTMRSDESIVWEEGLPYTLHDVIVTEEGTAFGYGYFGDSSGQGVGDEVVMAVIDEKGAVTLEQRRMREPFPAVNKYPHVSRMGYLDSKNLVWLSFAMGKPSELPTHEFQVVDLTKKEFREAIDFREKLSDGKGHVTAIEQIEEAPFWIVRWLVEDAEQDSDTHHLAIVDIEGNEQWRREPSSESEGKPGLRAFSLNPMEFVFDDGIQTVTMKIEDEGGSWNFNEVARTENDNKAIVIPTPTATDRKELLDELPVVTITPDRSFSLDRGDPTSDDVLTIERRFVFDGFGNVYTYSFGEEDLTFQKINGEGEVTETKSVLYDHPYSSLNIVWQEEESFIILLGTADNATHIRAAQLFRYNFSSNELTQLSDHKFWAVTRLDANVDGNILVSSRESTGPFSERYIQLFDREGNLLLRIDEEEFQKKCPKCRLGDVALLTDGRIAVLDSSFDQVHLLSTSGALEETIVLSKSWGYKPNRLSSICSAPNGGFVVEDFYSRYPMVEMDSSGVVSRKYRVSGTIDPLGNLWVWNGFTLKQESESGEVLKTIGHEPSDEASGHVYQLSVDQTGRLYVLPARSGIPHVYGPDGKLIYRAAIASGTIRQPESARYSMRIPGNGGLMLTVREKVESIDLPQTIHEYEFNGSGQRIQGEIESVEFATDSLRFYNRGASSPVFMLDQERQWARKSNSVVIQDRAGNVLKEANRDANNRWLKLPKPTLQAPDGSILVLNDLWSLQNSEKNYTVYSTEAEVLSGMRISDLPSFIISKNSAWDGNYIYTKVDGKFVIIDSEGSLSKILEMPGVEGNHWQPYVTMNGSELWFFDGDREVVCVRISEIHAE